MKLECVLELGPEAAARQFYLESRDHTSNPYKRGTENHRLFAEELSRQYQNELTDLMEGNHG